MDLKTGQRLRSRVCATEAIVIKAAPGDVDLRCGGWPMGPIEEVTETSGSPAPGFDTGTQLGKRYVIADDTSLELLVTKPGAGSLSVGEQPLTVKGAKPLPASD